MITVKPKASKEMKCQDLECAKSYAEDQAISVGFADVFIDGEIKYTYYCHSDNLNVKVIEH